MRRRCRLCILLLVLGPFLAVPLRSLPRPMAASEERSWIVDVLRSLLGIVEELGHGLDPDGAPAAAESSPRGGAAPE